MISSSADMAIYKGIYLGNTAVAMKCSKTQNDARVLLEEWTLKSVHHPHIVQFLGGFTDKIHYLVLEYIEGLPFDQLAKQKDSRLDVLMTVWQMSGALGYLHVNNIVHGALHPSHVIVTRGDGDEVHAKLISLAAPRTSDERSINKQRGDNNKLQRWQAPETFQSAIRGTTADVYSLAMLLWSASRKASSPSAPPRTNSSPIPYVKATDHNAAIGR